MVDTAVVGPSGDKKIPVLTMTNDVRYVNFVLNKLADGLAHGGIELCKLTTVKIARENMLFKTRKWQRISMLRLLGFGKYVDSADQRMASDPLATLGLPHNQHSKTNYGCVNADVTTQPDRHNRTIGRSMSCCLCPVTFVTAADPIAAGLKHRPPLPSPLPPGYSGYSS